MGVWLVQGLVGVAAEAAVAVAASQAGTASAWTKERRRIRRDILNRRMEGGGRRKRHRVTQKKA